jgi:hypothetical protein
VDCLPTGSKSIANGRYRIKQQMKDEEKSVFDEQYSVVAVESDRLLIRGIVSGKMLTIINPEPATSLNKEDYPPGKLIALSDPSIEPLN